MIIDGTSCGKAESCFLCIDESSRQRAFQTNRVITRPRPSPFDFLIARTLVGDCCCTQAAINRQWYETRCVYID